MNRYGRILPLLLSTLCAVSVLTSCKEDVDLKEFSKGTTMEVLGKKGNFNLFLKAVDISGYKTLVDGGGLVTVFAPDDDAMKAYLAGRYGTDDPAKVPVEDLKVLVGYHIIQFSYTPEDFLAFATVTQADGTSDGDGSCYKYKTYSKDPVYKHFDPIRQRNVNIYRRERYMPVFSTRLFKNRGIADMEKDYRRFFPNVSWNGNDDKLYAGDAAVLEMGIPTDNGYLYTVDKVLEYAPTIYDFLNSEAGKDYSIIKRMFDRLSCYTYDVTTTKNYSSTGDSLFFFYHWTAPTRAGEIPEIASEWTYHNEAGVAFDRALKYCSNCFLPKDEVLRPYLNEFFKEWITPETVDVVNELPENTIYHFLMAHLFCNREIILPSELDAAPLNGENGERFQLNSDELDIRYCSNGVVYGMDEVFTPAVFSHLSRPVFEHPDYMFFARGMNIKSMYQQTVDDNNRFTMFLVNDHDMAVQGYSSGESPDVHGGYTYKKNSNLGESAVSTLLQKHFVYGDVDLVTPGSVRYYVSKDDKTYFYVKDGDLFGATDDRVTVQKKYDTANGSVYELNQLLPDRSGGYSISANGADFTEFRSLMVKAGLVNANGELVNKIQESLVFIPKNDAVVVGRMYGLIPANVDTLKQYLQYYFVPITKNHLEHFLLPGLGPEGMTSEAFGDRYMTLCDYKKEEDAKYLSVFWDPAVPDRMGIVSSAGDTLRTQPDRAELRTNCAVFALDECFDYKTILR